MHSGGITRPFRNFRKRDWLYRLIYYAWHGFSLVIKKGLNNYDVLI